MNRTENVNKDKINKDIAWECSCMGNVTVKLCMLTILSLHLFGLWSVYLLTLSFHVQFMCFVM